MPLLWNTHIFLQVGISLASTLFKKHTHTSARFRTVRAKPSLSTHEKTQNKFSYPSKETTMLLSLLWKSVMHMCCVLAKRSNRTNYMGKRDEWCDQHFHVEGHCKRPCVSPCTVDRKFGGIRLNRMQLAAMTQFLLLAVWSCCTIRSVFYCWKN